MKNVKSFDKQNNLSFGASMCGNESKWENLTF